VPGSAPANRAVARFLTRARSGGVAGTLALPVGIRADHVHNVVKVAVAIPFSVLVVIIAQLRDPLLLGWQVIVEHAASALSR
jgi:hypothetical protein